MSNPIQHLKGLGAGRRVFLVGNGPSLNAFTLDAIAAEESVAMNRVNLLYPATNWRPSYYIFCSANCTNWRWGEAWSQSVVDAAAEPRTQPIIWRRYKAAIEGWCPGSRLPERTLWLHHVTESPIGDPAAFSTDAAARIDKSGTSMNVALQLAYYMGFKETYLLGCDSHWQTATDTPVDGDPNHFSGDYHAHIADGAEEFRRMNETHKVAAAAFVAAGLEVYDATPGGALTAYPKRKLEEIL